MKRTPLKTLSRDDIEFIPSNYSDMDKNAESIYDRPLIFIGRRLTREEKYEFESITSIKYLKDPKEIDFENIKPGDVKITGISEATKYLWDKCIKGFKNIILEEGGKVSEYPEYDNTAAIWNCGSLDKEIMEAITFFKNQSIMSEEEAKN